MFLKQCTPVITESVHLIVFSKQCTLLLLKVFLKQCTPVITINTESVFKAIVFLKQCTPVITESVFF